MGFVDLEHGGGRALPAPRSRAAWAAGLAIVCLLPGCSVPLRSWPFPRVEAESLPGASSIVELRVAGVDSLYALLTFSFEVNGEGGVFDAAVRYRSPGDLRMTAFKDVLIQTRPVFDLVIGGGRYALTLETPDGTRQSAGPLEALADESPGFRALALFRQALFLPGLGSRGPLRIDAESAGLEVRGSTPGGAAVAWSLEPDTLGVMEGRLLETPSPIVARYTSYRAIEGRYIPEAFELEDEGERVHVEGRVLELELNPALDASDFEAPGLEEGTRP